MLLKKISLTALVRVSQWILNVNVYTYLLLEKKVNQDSSIWDVLHCKLLTVIEVSKESSGFICSVRRVMRALCSLICR